MASFEEELRRLRSAVQGFVGFRRFVLGAVADHTESRFREARTFRQALDRAATRAELTIAVMGVEVEESISEFVRAMRRDPWDEEVVVSAASSLIRSAGSAIYAEGLKTSTERVLAELELRIADNSLSEQEAAAVRRLLADSLVPEDVVVEVDNAIDQLGGTSETGDRAPVRAVAGRFARSIVGAFQAQFVGGDDAGAALGAESARIVDGSYSDAAGVDEQPPRWTKRDRFLVISRALMGLGFMVIVGVVALVLHSGGVGEQPPLGDNDAGPSTSQTEPGAEQTQTQVPLPTQTPEPTIETSAPAPVQPAPPTADEPAPRVAEQTPVQRFIENYPGGPITFLSDLAAENPRLDDQVVLDAFHMMTNPDTDAAELDDFVRVHLDNSGSVFNRVVGTAVAVEDVLRNPSSNEAADHLDYAARADGSVSTPDGKAGLTSGAERLSIARQVADQIGGFDYADLGR